MRKFLVLVLAFALLPAFRWGGEEETTTPQKTSTYSPRPAYSQTSNTAKESTAAVNASSAVAVTQALGTDDPEQLKTRVESLARVSRALQALNASKAG